MQQMVEGRVKASALHLESVIKLFKKKKCPSLCVPKSSLDCLSWRAKYPVLAVSSSVMCLWESVTMVPNRKADSVPSKDALLLQGILVHVINFVWNN